MSETNRIEHKQELTPDLEKEAVAFLNYTGGGVIWIGIDKTGAPVRIADPDWDMLKIKDRLKHNILPSCMGLFDVVSESKEGKNYPGQRTRKALLSQEVWHVLKGLLYSGRHCLRAYACAND